MAVPVLSTYRLQLRGPDSGFGFTFADAENLLDYLDLLGVSHLYLSPVLTAAPGSSHGYELHIHLVPLVYLGTFLGLQAVIQASAFFPGLKAARIRITEALRHI